MCGKSCSCGLFGSQVSLTALATIDWYLWLAPDHVRWISEVLGEAITAAQSTGLVLDPRVYITGSTPPTPPVATIGYADSDKGSISAESPISEKDVKMSLPAYSALRILHGRPSIRKILREEITASTGPVSVDGTESSL